MRLRSGQKKYERVWKCWAGNSWPRSRFLQLVKRNINVLVFEERKGIVTTAYSEHTTPKTLRTIWFGAQEAPKPQIASGKNLSRLYG